MYTGVITPKNAPKWVLSQKKRFLLAKDENVYHPKTKTWHQESIGGWPYYKLRENL